MDTTVSRKSIGKFMQWFDSDVHVAADENANKIDWARVIPFIAMHVACLGVVIVGWSPVALAVAILSYFTRMFAITAFYHRYFAHRAFRTSRFCQFLFALLGATATQRGPLWWAAHHRRHHRFSDTNQDVHSPRHGFWWSHMGWFLCQRNFKTELKFIRDLAKYPELRWLDRFDAIIPVLYGTSLWLLGDSLQTHYPDLQTNGWQMLVWGYFISSVVMIHCTLLVNSMAHRFGSRRYATSDNSRNNFFLAVITLGEGWHNNHHHYPVSARQGFFWWEIDISYYLLKTMQGLGLIWGLQAIPVKRLKQNLLREEH